MKGFVEVLKSKQRDLDCGMVVWWYVVVIGHSLAKEWPGGDLNATRLGVILKDVPEDNTVHRPKIFATQR